MQFIAQTYPKMGYWKFHFSLIFYKGNNNDFIKKIFFIIINVVFVISLSYKKQLYSRYTIC